MDEAAGDDIGIADDGARLGVDRGDDHDHAVFGHHAAVAQDDLGNVADAQAVHHDIIGIDLLLEHQRLPAFLEFDDIAVVQDENLFLAEAFAQGQLLRFHQHVVIGVDRQEIIRLDLVQDLLDVIHVGVAAGMDVHDAAVDDVVAQAVDAVLDLLDGALVARDDRGGEDDDIRFLDGHVAVVAAHDAREDGVGLALGAGADDHDAVFRILMDVFYRDQGVLMRRYVAELLGDAHVHLHAVAVQGDFLPDLLAVGEQISDALQLGGEGADDDAMLGAADDLLQVGQGSLDRHPLLGIRDAEALQHQDAGRRQLGQVIVSDGLAAERIVFQQPVAGMDDRAVRRLQDDADRVDDGMLHREETDLELAQRYLLVDIIDGDGLEILGRAVLIILLAVLDHGQRQFPADDGRVAQLFQEDGGGADMVQMAVAEDDAADIALLAAQGRDIGDDVIYARHVFVGELHAHVQDDDVVIVLEDGAIAADLFLPAQRVDLQGRFAQGRLELAARTDFIGHRGPAGKRGAAAARLIAARTAFAGAASGRRLAGTGADAVGAGGSRRRILFKSHNDKMGKNPLISYKYGSGRLLRLRVALPLESLGSLDIPGIGVVQPVGGRDYGPAGKTLQSLGLDIRIGGRIQEDGRQVGGD